MRATHEPARAGPLLSDLAADVKLPSE